MSDDLLKDFDILSPPKRTAIIGGEEIDVSFIPARAALKFVDFSKKYNVNSLEPTEGFDPGMLDLMLEIIEMICKRSSEKITKDWLLDNVDIKILMEFVQFVFAGMKKVDADGGECGKNSESGTS